jgi:hypothetical protein
VDSKVGGSLCGIRPVPGVEEGAAVVRSGGHPSISAIPCPRWKVEPCSRMLDKPTTRPSLSLLVRHGADAGAQGSNPSRGIHFSHMLQYTPVYAHHQETFHSTDTTDGDMCKLMTLNTFILCTTGTG